MRSKKLGRRFIGYNLKQVDAYFDELQRSCTEGIQQIKGSLDDYNTQREKLRQHIEEKNEALEQLFKSQKFMDLAQKRAEGMVNLMNIAADNELKDIESMFSKKIDEIDDKIERIKKDIGRKEDQLEFLKKSQFKLQEKKIKAEKSNVRIIKDNLGYTRGKNIIKPSSFWNTIEVDDENAKNGFSLKETDKNENRDYSNTGYSKDAVPVKKENVKSTALSMHVDSARNRYLAGKVAGENLTDNQGNIIIKKNEPITPEIVKKAEQEGKLAELIVYMMLPGIEN